MKRLVLGSSQFGSLYGIRNSSERVSFNTMSQIVKTAKLLDISTIDTAVTYGDAELRLGKLDLTSFKINSKIPAPRIDHRNMSAWVLGEIEKSLERLNITSLDTIFVHDANWLLTNDGSDFIKGLLEAQKTKLVNKIGISIYQSSDIPDLFKLHDFDVIQAPLNLIDRRFETSGWLSELKNKGVEIQVRSIFLQGLLLIPTNKLPLKFNRWKTIWEEFEEVLNISGTSSLEACLSYPMSINDIDKIIVGVDSVNQLLAIDSFVKSENLIDKYSFMSTEDIELITPSLWSTL